MACGGCGKSSYRGMTRMVNKMTSVASPKTVLHRCPKCKALLEERVHNIRGKWIKRQWCATCKVSY